MKDPLISIIVPVYNTETFLNRCIESILAQSYSNFELIIINDGSSDSSADICQQFSNTDKRIKLYSQQKSGVSVARNVGLDLIKGEWVTFIDSDDWIDKEMLQHLSNIAMSNKGIDWITSGITYQYADGSKSIETPTKTGLYCCDTECEFRVIVTQPLVTSPVAKLYRADIIKKHHLKFDKTLYYGEDRDFNIRFLNHCSRCIITNYSGYNYQKDIQNSLSALKIGNILKGDIDYWNKLFCLFNKYQFSSIDSHKYLVHRLFHFINDAISYNRLERNQIKMLKSTVNWQYIKDNQSLIDANGLIKYLIVHKHLKALNLIRSIFAKP